MDKSITDGTCPCKGSYSRQAFRTVLWGGRQRAKDPGAMAVFWVALGSLGSCQTGGAARDGSSWMA